MSAAARHHPKSGVDPPHLVNAELLGAISVDRPHRRGVRIQEIRQSAQQPTVVVIAGLDPSDECERAP